MAPAKENPSFFGDSVVHAHVGQLHSLEQCPIESSQNREKRTARKNDENT
jgi:hypothetical protein